MVGRFGPFERPGVLVVSIDESADVGFEFPDGGMNTALEPSSVIRIPRTLFMKMLEGYPDAARRLRKMIADRADAAMEEIRSVRPVLDIGDEGM